MVTSLFKIKNDTLYRVPMKALEKEQLIENWVTENPALAGLDAIIIGRQVPTPHGGYIDLLAIDRTGSIIILELKRDRTPREVVAQVLDYASWIRTLDTSDIYDIADKNREPQWLAKTFVERFGESPPEQLNTVHSMLIVASSLDQASQRIVKYLSEEHGISINTVFFTVFGADGETWLTTDFLLEQSDVEERSTRKSRAPWSGYYFVNAGAGDDRSWDDMRKYGFVGASGGDFYTKRLDQLREGDKLFAYQKGDGYVGYGVVTAPKILASQFVTPTGLLFEQDLDQPNIKTNAGDPSKAEYVVGVDWIKTFDIPQARSFRGIFANQNIVCKIRDPATIAFLIKAFDSSSA